MTVKNLKVTRKGPSKIRRSVRHEHLLHKQHRQKTAVTVNNLKVHRRIFDGPVKFPAVYRQIFEGPRQKSGGVPSNF